jgi:hypothetical protein
MDFGDFLQILSQEMEGDNHVRMEAERKYTLLLSQDVSLVVNFHMEHLLSESTKSLKSLSLIHLQHIYKLFDVKNLVMPQEITELVCSHLLSLFEIKEFGPSEMGNVVFIVAYIGAFYIARDIFVELPNQLLALCKDFSSPYFSSYMACLSQIIIRLPNYELQIDAGEALGIVSSCFAEGSDAIYNISAIKILFALVTNRNVGFDENLVALAPNVAEVLVKLSGDPLYQLLSDIDVFVALYSSFFAETMGIMIEALLTVASNAEIEEQSRTRAISATTKLVQNESAACVEFLGDIIRAYINIGCEITEKDWLTIDYDITLSEYALERLGMLFLVSDISSQAIEITMGAVRELIDSEEWENTYTALVALVKIISADSAQTAASLEEIATIIITNMSNETPMCRSAAANAMSSACTMYKPAIQEAYNDDIITTYLTVIAAGGIPQSLADMIYSLGKYCQECPSALIIPHVAQILEIIKPFIEIDDPKIQSYVIVCVNVFAEKLKIDFAEFYPTMAEWVGAILPAEISPETTILRASAIEMVSLMGYCTDTETFAVSADECMKIFTSWDYDSLTFNEYEKLMAAFSTIAKLTPSVFLQYIDGIFTYLYNEATSQLKPAVHKEFSNEYHDSKETITYYFNNCVIEVNSGDNIRRIATIYTLGTLLETLGHEEAFKQYMGRTKQALGNNLFKFFYKNLVETSISCLFKFFDIITPPTSEEDVQQLSKFGEKFISMMIKVVESTVVPTIVSCAINHIRLAIQILVANGVFKSTNVIRDLLALVPKFDEANSQLKDPTNQQIIDAQYGALITLWFELFTEDAVALIEEIREVYPLTETEPRLLALELWVNIYIFTDCSNDDLQSQLIHNVFNGIGSDSPYVSTTCFFCLARLFKKSQFLEETIQEAIAIILSVSNDFISKRVIDAAMIALGVILMSGCEIINREEVLSSWVDNLPIMTKHEDTDNCYEFFLSMIESGEIQITPDLIMKITLIIAKLCNSKVVSDTIMEHFHALACGLRENAEICPVFDECIEKAEISDKQRIVAFLQ